MVYKLISIIPYLHCDEITNQNHKWIGVISIATLLSTHMVSTNIPCLANMITS